MRPAQFAPLLVLLALGACTTTRDDGSQQIQTSAEANQESLGDAVAAPLRDMNVLRTKIPEVLLDAMADPYARPAGDGCDAIILAVRPLDGALGADLDEPSINEDDVVDKGRDTALGAVAAVTSDVIPFRGWVRKLTGAEKHDRLVQAAITAGAVRRAYLKGLGESRGCNPPATPSHILTGSPVPRQELKPRYPIR